MPLFTIRDMHPFFEDVQMNRVFPDGKTFVDCLPKQPVEIIAAAYAQQKKWPGFNLKTFILEYFELPVPHSTNYQSDKNKPAEENIELLWDVLTRPADKKEGTIIPLPFPYVVPGGRFGEIYYWDSYFTMLGLKASGKITLLENMVKNFSYLIDTLGYIPNGNRTYYAGRSQPPFYSLMLQLLADSKGKDVFITYLPQLEKEYAFWMKGSNGLTSKNMAVHHSVLMPDGELLNRYWDENDTPRPESYRDDVELSRQSAQEPEVLYKHLRAGAESGWDYSCRWFKQKNSFASIHTTDIIPVDLNCLLWNLEKTIAEAYRLQGDEKAAGTYNLFSELRKKTILKYCWNYQYGFYCDYDYSSRQQKVLPTLACMFPLFFKIASDDHSVQTAALIKEKFLKPGGVVSTLEVTGQQWDAPNGWAPLQWITIMGLENYGYSDLAIAIAERWIKLNKDVFKRTGKLMEKYNVIDIRLEAGGGEYPGQDGFGWTNGVLLALIKKYKKKT